MTLWKRQNYGDNKNINSCQGLAAEGGAGELGRVLEQGNCSAWYCEGGFPFQAYRVHNTSSDPNAECGLWTVLVRQHVFTAVGDAPLQWGVLITGDALHREGEGLQGKPLYLLLSSSECLKLF